MFSAGFPRFILTGLFRAVHFSLKLSHTIASLRRRRVHPVFLLLAFLDGFAAFDDEDLALVTGQNHIQAILIHRRHGV